MKISKFSNQPSTFISMDASTNSVGYAIFHEGKLKRYGKINFTGKNIYSKIFSAATSVHEALKDLPIEAVVIERAVFINSPKTMSELSMVQGAILAGCGLAGIKVFRGTNPIAWQTFIGNGKLNKEEKLKIRTNNPGKSESWYKNFEREFRKLRTIHVTNIAYDIDNDDNDIADAIGMGHYALSNWEKLGD